MPPSPSFQHRAQRHLHHLGEAGLALLGRGFLVRGERIGNGKQARRVLARHLGVVEQGKALHLYGKAALFIAQGLPCLLYTSDAADE